METKIGRILLTLVRLLAGGVFVYAGIVKVWDFSKWESATQSFAFDILHYELTSWDVSLASAVYLPWLEIVAGLALILRRWQIGALVILNGLTVLFLGAISSAWWRGLDISCGCFGKAEEAIKANYPWMLSRDAILLLALATLLVIEWRRMRTVGPAFDKPLSSSQ